MLNEGVLVHHTIDVAACDVTANLIERKEMYSKSNEPDISDFSRRSLHELVPADSCWGKTPT